MIYFIRGAVSGSVKIGYTGNDPARRLAQLQTGSPEKLELIGSIEGGVEAERELHSRFASHRLRPDGEWFAAADEVTRGIKNMLTPEPDFPVLFGAKIETVYLAGKITNTDWRRQIAPDWGRVAAAPGHWGAAAIECPVRGRRPLLLTGPYWSDTEGYGSPLAASFPHATGVPRTRDCFGRRSTDELDFGTAWKLSNAVRAAIICSDVVFVCVDSLDCFGTIFELGYARGMSKRIVICKPYSLDLSQLWLAFMNATAFRSADSPSHAWDCLFEPGSHDAPIDDPCPPV